MPELGFVMANSFQQSHKRAVKPIYGWCNYHKAPVRDSIAEKTRGRVLGVLSVVVESIWEKKFHIYTVRVDGSIAVHAEMT